MRHSAWWCGVMIAVAGCSLPTGTKLRAASGGKATPTATAGTPKAGLVPAASPESARRKGLVSAIQNTLVAGDLARSQNAIQLLSDNGLGLLSDNGLGIIANNGGGLLANNGSGYRVAQSAPEVYYEREHERAGLMWITTFYKPDYRGEVKAYPVAAFKAQGKAARAVEHYTWDALGIHFKNPSFPLAFPLEAALTYKIKPLASERFTFIKRMNLVFDMTIKSIDPPPAEVAHNGFTGTYDMEVPLADGTKEVISMAVYDMTYEPGEAPGASGVFYAPKTFKAKGANDRGSLDMLVERDGDTESARTLAMNLKATHTAKAGRQSKLELIIDETNQQTSIVTDVEGGMQAEWTLAPDRTGTGTVRAVGATAVLGNIAWTPQGLGTITFSDGTKETVRVF
ncbi:MAG: hypothetical protein ACK46X_09085 [Candidatus Sericytochromatia bacterium]